MPLPRSASRLLPVLLFLFSWPVLLSGVAQAEGILINGGRYVALRTFSDRLDMRLHWRVPEKELVLSGTSARIEFTAGSREIRINDLRAFLGEPAIYHGRELFVTEVDYKETLRPLLIPQARPSVGHVRTIVLDAGHGGRDSGTRNNQLKLLEKNLTLEVVKRLQRILELQGFRVLLTRSHDSYVDLKERALFANRMKADLFVSIHFNAVGNSGVHGTETYILTPRTHRSTGQDKPAKSDLIASPGNQNDHWNILLGFVVQRQLLRDLGTFDRGLKRARFQVLRGVECPAVLVETGYLSNEEEARKVRTEEYQNNLVRALAIAINRYQQAVEQVEAARQ